jgi:sugar/nucleoside kinase (ribokinase family)
MIDAAAQIPPMIAVLGSAHLDIVGHIMDNDTVVDHVGFIDVRAGGTAYNIAAACGQAGQPVRLITAMTRSILSRYVQSEALNAGVAVRY